MPLDDFIIYVYCYVADIFPQIVDVSLRRRGFELKLTDSGKWSASFGKDKHRRANSHWQCAMIGPPGNEKLVGDLAGAYSRRINIQHRLSYEVIINEKVVRVLRMWTRYERTRMKKPG